MNYRSDIDGLRTIAVFTVILNHAGIALFSGGFVGVDVFFVISGFLITSIIYPRIVENTFSMGWFLSRRIKRLMPVLFFVIFVTAVAFTFVMLPQDLATFYQSIVWVVLYAGNFFMWIHHGGYFDGNSQEAPLLHTWSLAVEEQYYFVWPVMLILSVRLLGPKVTAWLSVILFIALTIFSQWGTEVTVGAAYYLLPTRFFELLLGSSLAIFWHKLPEVKTSVHHILSIIGVTLILASAVFLNEHSSFPGYNALYATIGTAILIYSQRGVINKFLSTKAMVYSGNISYSLYLWHWPIFTLLRYMSIELTAVVQLGAILFTYLLSMLSYQYIEQPLRHSRINAFLPIAIKFYTVPAMLMIAFALVGVSQQGYPERFEPQIVNMEKALNTHSSDSRKACHSAFREHNRQPDASCIFGNHTAENKGVFIFGDSHANHLVPFVQELVKDAGLWGQDYTMDRCLPVGDLNWGGNLYKAQRCKARNAVALQHMEEQGFAYVVLAASWPGFDTRRIFNETARVTDIEEIKTLFQQKLINTIDHIVKQGVTPILFEDTPTLAGKSPKCPIKQILYDESLSCEITLQNNRFISDIFSHVQSLYPQTIVIKPSELFCQQQRCTMQIENIPLYRDDDHLNEEGAKILARKYLAQVGNPIRKLK
ncbi:acyltransferase [Thalassotalea insulae]|uniref:Acyltransferase n=1 Tax=Thalassotalea insulae TaxID=2056778 RepID=A0ABQ6GUL3_9GAMM|nr:acyltransferase family protein [Thalassotalea insulae]GLX78190.1 acyltransferase [Thalassotalea insulae]